MKVMGLAKKDINALASFMRNILGIDNVDNLVIVIMDHLIKNPGIMERIEQEVIHNRRKVVFVGDNEYYYRKITGQSLCYDELVREICLVKNFFLIKDVRPFIENPI